MSAIGERKLGIVACQSEPGFVHKSRGLERVTGGLIGHPRGGEFAEFLVDQRQQFLRGLGVATLSSIQDLGDLAQALVDSGISQGKLRAELTLRWEAGFGRTRENSCNPCLPFYPASMRILAIIRLRQGFAMWLAAFAAICSIFIGCGSKTGKASAQDQELADFMQEVQTPEYRMKENRQFPLHIAAEDGNTNEVARLLSNGAFADVRDGWKRTPLHLAAEWGYVGIVKDLLSAGADVNAQTKFGETPLFFALRYWHGDEEEGAGKDHWSALVKTLIAAGARFDIVNSSGLTPLHLAAGAKFGSPEVVQAIIQGGANVNAAEEGGDTVLHFAAGRGKTENVKLLLAAGANVQAPGRGGYTPLHSAAGHSSASAAMVRLLIEAKADVNAKDENGETPLHHMSPLGDSDWVKELLKAGANSKAKCDEGRTPLHVAAATGRADIARLLLEDGVEVNAVDNEGHTPLDMTAQPKWPIPEIQMNACVTLIKERGGRKGNPAPN